MKFSLKKKIVIPTVLSGFLLVGMSFQNDFFELAKQIEIFTSMFKVVNQNYVDETNPGNIMDVAIKGMLKELDPYTVFFNEQDVLKYKINNTGEYTGIGALITRRDGQLILREVYQNMPADKAGFKAGDIITQIGDVNLKDFKEDASALLKGAKNTKIDILYTRQGVQKKGQIVLDEVEIKAVPYYKLLANQTGYIVLSKFNEKASAETKEALLKLKEQGATKIILDLRDNPGGLLHEAVNICNLFVPKDEVIVTTKSKNTVHNHTYKTRNEPVDTEIPLAVIVNDRSASASEIVSGALQDLDRAVIVGNRSFGKGLVQRPFNLAYGTQVKVTISKYYTPSGRCIQATDYSKKDENGKPIKTSEKEYNAFKTKKGRTVYDGGGVLPDVEILDMKLSTIGRNINETDAIFDFATVLYYKNPNAKMPTMISDAEFNEFKAYLKKEKIEINTNTEKNLKSLLEAAKKEKIDNEISVEVKQLEAAIDRSKDKELDKQKEEIKRLLYQELLLRYGYRNAFYDYVSSKYSDVSKAMQLVNTPAEYNKILKK
ncbi:Probable membrane associated S41A family C-terminal processing peptidase [Flavobacterium indicum GPTSA100-9 = DSM 17447]|uniref:Probable membrane associated S41A family C-terminal processing peptidase n=1 Tax=Flavobacterium indicum (strain DSM 17447 / CIP 109464 / GPTSA100-9) TaxID=1094466 RepID=H8XNC5_FLAIG|nr:S41 family peptidase [Flavobacterium indicum]CCG52042.1 Probable membrane associated S41A family C-terminal processing peptidase [Flavobacterium indicum GPTSA100-9 = DSM 17447]